MAQEWRAVDPARAALAFAVVVGARQPAHFGGYAAAFGKGLDQLVADARAAADAVEERRLEDAWDAQRG